jgi:glycerol-3-phosphate acyltransferase PlsX
MRIAVDAMGGDHAPAKIVEGAVLAAKEFADTEFILVGDQEAVKKELAVNHAEGVANLSITHAPEVMGMGEAPIEAVRGKRKSSVTMGVQLVAEGRAEAVFSAGNTGAAVAAATVLMKPLGAIKRPGIAVSFPTHFGTTTIIDVGANIHCQPDHGDGIQSADPGNPESPSRAPQHRKRGQKGERVGAGDATAARRTCARQLHREHRGI